MIPKTIIVVHLTGNWKMKKSAEKDLKKLEFNIDVDNNVMKDLNNEDVLHFNNDLANNNNADIEDIGVINKYDNQHNHFGAPEDNIQQQNHHFGSNTQQILEVDNKYDDYNGHFNVVGDEELSAGNNNDKMTLTLILILVMNLFLNGVTRMTTQMSMNLMMIVTLI